MTFDIEWRAVTEEPPREVSILVKTEKDEKFAAFYEGNHCFRASLTGNKIDYLYSANTDLQTTRLYDGKKTVLGFSTRSIAVFGKVTHWNLPC